jgi:DNA-binding LytR/AlgR family response regulator
MKKASILVVDDEAQIRRVLQATLSSNGYDVIEARNGKEAISAVLREHPDLILLDVNMPGISGCLSPLPLREFILSDAAWSLPEPAVPRPCSRDPDKTRCCSNLEA